jgi:endonuclease YncB( thermonuclease family)
MNLRSLILLASCACLMRLAAQDPAAEPEPAELTQLRRQFELQALSRARLLSEQYANALANIARETGGEGDYDQALAAQRRREHLIRLYTSSMEDSTLTNVILLKPADARVNGAVNYDRNLNALVSWKTAGSIATWDVSRLTPGAYEVTLTYAVADFGEPGRTVYSGPAPDLSTGGAFDFYEDSSLSGAESNHRTGTVASTGGWTNWQTLTLPPIQLTRPSARLALKITRAKGSGGVMNLKGIRLAPPTAGGSTPGVQSDPEGDVTAPVDPFITLQLAHVERLREAIKPVVSAFSEKMSALASEHATNDPEAANDYAAEARRAAQLLENPRAIIISAPGKGPRQGPSPEGFREMQDVTYVPSPRNTADRFKVRQGPDEFFVRLSWVSCPPTDAKEEKLLSEHAAYFGISAEDVLAVGQKAQDFTAKFLAGKPLTLLTRGTKDGEDNLLVSVRPGGMGDFAGVLVDHGLAMIQPPAGKKGPARLHDESVARNLAEREKSAKSRPIPPGAWARTVDE